MIRISCPRCKQVMVCQDREAGNKLHCPKCGQRLQVPVPPKAKTVLAKLETKDTTLAPRSARKTDLAPEVTPVAFPVAKLAPAPEASHSGGSGVIKTLLLLCAAGGFVVLVCAGVGAFIWFQNRDAKGSTSVASKGSSSSASENASGSSGGSDSGSA